MANNNEKIITVVRVNNPGEVTAYFWENGVNRIASRFVSFSL